MTSKRSTDITDEYGNILPFYLPLPEHVMSSMFYEGREGQLFLRGDSNDVRAQIQGDLLASPEQQATFMHVHCERRDELERRGIAYRHVVCPNKETALADYLPDEIGYEINGPSYARQLIGDGASGAFFSPKSLGVSDYFQTDSHWNERGALRYLQSSLDVFGDARAAATLSNLRIRESPRQWQGDLGRYAHLPPESATYLNVTDATTRVHHQGNLLLEGNLRLQRSNRPSSRGWRALILHDSFAFFLFKIIGELYEEALFIHGPDLDIAFAEAYRPDVVWFFQVERFLTRPPRNGIDLISWIEQIETAKGARGGGDFLASLLDNSRVHLNPTSSLYRR